MDIFQGSSTHVVMKAATKLLSSKTSNELLSKGIPRHSVSFIKYRPSLLQFSEVLNLMSESGEFDFGTFSVDTMSAHAPQEVTRTITTTQPTSTTTVTLKPRSKKKSVQWTEDVVDNEGMGKRSSKICCVYTPPEDWDATSSDSDSSSEGEHTCDGHDHHHHHKKHKKPRQHPHDDKPFTGDYSQQPTV